MTLEVWDERGIADCHWSPIYTYGNEGDVGVNQLGGMLDDEGDGYYVSYPPFGFYLPYFVFQATGADISVENLTVFSLFLHFIGGLFIWLILYSIYNRSGREEVFLPAFIGYAIYLFSAATLWFHSNIYFVDMLVQILWIVEAYLFIRILKNPEHKWLPIIFGAFNFMAIYTEWIGIFFAMVAFVITVIIFWKKRQFKVPIIIAITTLIPIGMTFYSYSSITDFDTLIDVSVNKYKFRSGHNPEDLDHGINSGKAFVTFNQKYNQGFKPILELLGFLAPLLIISLIFQKFRKVFSRQEGLLLLAILIPILMHHYLFFNFTVGHDFSTLKSGFLFAILASIIGYKFFKLGEERAPKWILAFVIPVFGLVAWKSVESVDLYHRENTREKQKTIHKELGEYIRANVPDDVAIVTGKWLGSPQTAFYAKRNTLEVNDPADAENKLRSKGKKKGVYIRVGPGLVIEGMDEINVTY